jgi:hypothetical protein
MTGCALRLSPALLLCQPPVRRQSVAEGSAGLWAAGNAGRRHGGQAGADRPCTAQPWGAAAAAERLRRRRDGVLLASSWGTLRERGRWCGC